MKGIKCTPLFFFLPIYLQAQTILVHVGGGLVNYGGDLQPRIYTLNQARGFIQAGMSVQWSHYIIDYSIAAGKVAASDVHSTSELKARNLSFYSNIGEATLTFEYDLNDISGAHKFTPYGFAGIGGFHFKPYAFDTAGNKVYLQPLGTEGQELEKYGNKNFYHLVQFNIPFGLGIKYAISKKIALCGEFGFRKIFTDYLDDVSSYKYADTTLLHEARGPLAAKMSFRADEIPGSTFKIGWQRGNPNVKDTYYTFLIKVIFSFEKGIFLY